MRTESAGKLTTSVGETGEKGRARSGYRIIKYQIPNTKSQGVRCRCSGVRKRKRKR